MAVYHPPMPASASETKALFERLKRDYSSLSKKVIDKNNKMEILNELEETWII